MLSSVIRGIEGKGRLRSFKTIVTLVLLFGIPLAFYFRYLFVYTGYAGWGNYFPFLTSGSLTYWTWNPPLLFNPYQFNGLAGAPTPQTVLYADLTSSLPVWILSHWVSIAVASRVFVVSVLALLMTSAYFLAAQITARQILRLLGTAFLTFNPFMIMILSAGDSQILIAESFILIGLALLIRELRLGGNLPTVGWLLSVAFLSFSILSYQAFLLGTLLYFVTLFIFAIRDNRVRSAARRRISSSVVWTLTYALATLALLVILVLPELVGLGSGGVGTGSFLLNPGISSLIQNGVPPWDLIILRGYPPNDAWQSVALAGNVVYGIWATLELILLIALLCVVPLMTRDIKPWLLSLGIVFFGFLGGGSQSLLFPLNQYLFLHFPGYQAINASYYWDWFLISPMYVLLFLTSIDSAIDRPRWDHLLFISRGLQYSRNQLKRFGLTIPHPRKTAITIICAVMLSVVAVPVATQASFSYGITNTWGQNLPPSYASIQPEINELIGNSSAGVAYFTPDVNVNITGASGWFVNPLINFPESRIAGLPYYGAPDTASNQYFYWIYSLFYQNQTKYLGELMALAGIQYFVVLNNTNSYSYDGGFMPYSIGQNATALMKFQVGVTIAYVGNGFSIYRNSDYSGVAGSFSGLTLVAGDFSELSVLPYYGFDLGKLGPILSSDLTPTSCPNVLMNTSTIVTPSLNALDGIVLRCASSSLHTFEFAPDDALSDSWVSTTDVTPSIRDVLGAVGPYALTDGHASMQIPLGIQSSGNYMIWVQTFDSSKPGYYHCGQLQLNAGGAGEVFDDGDSFDGTTNLFVWRQLDAYLNPGDTLSLDSLSGWNEIGDIIVTTTEGAREAWTQFNDTVRQHGIQIDMVTAAENVAPVGSGAQYQTEAVGSDNFPFGQITYLDPEAGFNASAVVYSAVTGPTTLGLELLHTGGGLIQIDYDNASQWIGFDAQNFSSPADSSAYFVYDSLNVSYGNSITIILLGGSADFGAILLVPRAEPPSKVVALPQEVNLTSVFIPDNQNVTDLALSSKVLSHSLLLNLTFNYNTTAPSDVPLASLNFGMPFNYSRSVSVVVSLENDSYVLFNSILVGNTSGEAYLISPGLFGSGDRESVPNLYLDVYSRSPRLPFTSGIVTLHLRMSFFDNDSVATFTGPVQQETECSVEYTNVGYIVDSARNLTLVRLPFYPAMQADYHVYSRTSVDDAIAQLLEVRAPADVSIAVVVTTEIEDATYVALGTVAGVLLVAILLPRIRRIRPSGSIVGASTEPLDKSLTRSSNHFHLDEPRIDSGTESR